MNKEILLSVLLVLPIVLCAADLELKRQQTVLAAAKYIPQIPDSIKEIKTRPPHLHPALTSLLYDWQMRITPPSDDKNKANKEDKESKEKLEKVNEVLDEMDEEGLLIVYDSLRRKADEIETQLNKSLKKQEGYNE